VEGDLSHELLATVLLRAGGKILAMNYLRQYCYERPIDCICVKREDSSHELLAPLDEGIGTRYADVTHGVQFSVGRGGSPKWGLEPEHLEVRAASIFVGREGSPYSGLEYRAFFDALIQQ
jgi:hypothetical protein